MTQPSLKFEQRHRLLSVVELAGDGGPGPVAGDVAADVGGRDARLGAEAGMMRMFRYCLPIPCAR